MDSQEAQSLRGTAVYLRLALTTAILEADVLKALEGGGMTVREQDAMRDLLLAIRGFRKVGL